MSSLKKRATWGMVVSMFFLLAGIALFHFGNHSLDDALKESFADIDKKSEEAIVIKMFVGGLPAAAGIGLTILGFFLFPLCLAIWVRNPPPGSKLTFRGWKTPAEMTEGERAMDKAWWAILWGWLATQAWFLQILLGGYRAFLPHTAFALKMLTPLIVICVGFYAVGIHLCRRRDPASVAATPQSWGFALAVNYGGLLVFLSLLGTLFVLRSRA